MQAELIEIVNAQRVAAGQQPWSPTRKSVHQYWRGIDFRSWIYTEAQRAQIIERALEAGPNEVVEDRTDAIIDMNPIALDAAGCACDATDGSMPTTLAVLGLLGLLGIRRRA